MKRTRVGAALLAFGLLGAGCGVIDAWEGEIAGMEGGMMVFSGGTGRADYCETGDGAYLETYSELREDEIDIFLPFSQDDVASEIALSDDPRLEGHTKVDVETVTDFYNGLGSLHGDVVTTDDDGRRFRGELAGTMVTEADGPFLVGFVNGHLHGQVKPLELEEEVESDTAKSSDNDYEMPGGQLETDFVGLYMAFPEDIDVDSTGDEVTSLHNGAEHADIVNSFFFTLGDFEFGGIGLSLAEEEAAVQALVDALPKEVAAEVNAEEIDIDDFFSTNGSSWFRPDEDCNDDDDERRAASEGSKAPKTPEAEKTTEPKEGDVDGDEGDTDAGQDNVKRIEKGAAPSPEPVVEETVVVEETASPLE